MYGSWVFCRRQMTPICQAKVRTWPIGFVRGSTYWDWSGSACLPQSGVAKSSVSVVRQRNLISIRVYLIRFNVELDEISGAKTCRNGHIGCVTARRHENSPV